MGKINFTTEEVNKIIDGRYHSPIQDIVGDNYTIGSPLAMASDTEYTFTCNGNTRNFSVFPDHVTRLWDTSTNLIICDELMNTPEIVANVQFTFDPTVSAAGIFEILLYVNETVPLLMKTYSVPYKSATSTYTILGTFYAGDATGFDVKNKGVIIKVKSSGAGNFYNPAIEVYRT